MMESMGAIIMGFTVCNTALLFLLLNHLGNGGNDGLKG